MKLTFWKGKNSSKSIHINSKFYSQEVIIPIGSDCHAAHILNALDLRKQSFIFDWLFSDSKYGINYINENINSDFSDFLKSLTRNERNHIISENFPHTEFFHEKNLIESENDKQKLKKKATRFLKIINNYKCTFLYVINPEHFKCKEDIVNFTEPLLELNQITQQKHKIKNFIKCTQSITDLIIVEELIEKCDLLRNVKTVKYLLNTEKFGMWGNSKDYFPLLKSLEINIKKSLIPKFYIE